MTQEIKCPKCSSTQLTANKKGFSGKQAVGGAILTGGIGLLAGTIGSNKINITCLACGNQWKPGDISLNNNGDIEIMSINQRKEFLKTDEGKAAARQKYMEMHNLPPMTDDEFKNHIQKKNNRTNTIAIVLCVAILLLLFFAC